MLKAPIRGIERRLWMKTVKEISITLENKPGTLSEISELMGASGINLLALIVKTMGAGGTLSFVASDPWRHRWSR